MHRWTVHLVLLGVAVTAAVGAWSGRLIGGATPDAVLAGGFGRSLDATETTWTTTPPNISLSSLGGQTAAFGRQIAVGDMITISARDGTPEAIEVTALEHVDGTRVGLAGVQFQLVTGRRVGKAGAVAPVRFLFAQDAPTETAPIRLRHGLDKVL